MWFTKKNPPGNLRRRFHHFLINQRKGEFLSKSGLARSKPLIKFPSPRVFPFFRKIFLFVTIIGLAGGLNYFLFLSSFFLVTQANLEKNGQSIPLAAFAPFLDQLKGKNILFLNGDTFSRTIEQSFKNEVLFVRLRKSYPNRVILKVEEYPLIVNLQVIAGEKLQTFVLNQIGYARSKNIEHKELPILVVRLPRPLIEKSVLIEGKKLAPMLLAFRKFTELFGMKIIEAEWKKGERELHLKTENNFFVWLDLTTNIEQQLLKLKRSLVKLDIYREPIEYIDLRIAGAESEKIIYKRRK